MSSTFYSLSTPLRSGTLDFSSLKGKVVLIVNVASQCGKTPQYKQLQQLHERYESDGLVIIGFPSNQFKQQEPGNDDEIAAFCSATYGVTFPLARKSDVNGPETNAVWKHAKAELNTGDIDWNFAKALFARDGTAVKYFPARTTSVDDLEPEIKKLL